MNVVRSAAAALAVMALLAGCVSAPVRVPAQVDPAVAGHADARRASLEAWGLAGRVAISGGRQGGSGRLDWVQQGGRYEVTLSAPVTRQGWRLSGDAGRARLEGVEGGPREGADVEALLLEATGWDIPVRALVAWVRGVAAPEAMHGPARVEYGADALPVRLEQAGWTIGYRDWFEAGANRPAMPRRIEASRGDARVRLVVDDWTLAPAAPEDAPPPAHGRDADGAVHGG
ncbi:lipoprotein insertase outer membrane protein LolB [Luteimonas wenzhouensis]|jgi:outer membrane lipoprotein LolB|uniref:Outer-membrane lipoprotein LolB n=1 Tax=Luteimonas wenzhouensis TaxID=2599615 RepID=A0A5C5U796_9GAMM|nr:lipoprotein insertase outer membrane protein LolB [Luteimonas wenzhouensis]NLW97475.1 outer membrane lipoprotein LolB [Xanthomonadaceae bacterium]TWT21924.1 outer membrane lipoprotein LolB [Luteimonas wenzhouensis]